MQRLMVYWNGVNTHAICDNTYNYIVTLLLNGHIRKCQIRPYIRTVASCIFTQFASQDKHFFFNNYIPS